LIPSPTLKPGHKHLLLRTNLENTPDVTDTVKRFLTALAQFQEGTAHIDRSVSNASRIVKVYGTMVRKVRTRLSVHIDNQASCGREVSSR